MDDLIDRAVSIDQNSSACYDDEYAHEHEWVFEDNRAVTTSQPTRASIAIKTAIKESGLDKGKMRVSLAEFKDVQDNQSFFAHCSDFIDGHGVYVGSFLSDYVGSKFARDADYFDLEPLESKLRLATEKVVEFDDVNYLLFFSPNSLELRNNKFAVSMKRFEDKSDLFGTLAKRANESGGLVPIVANKATSNNYSSSISFESSYNMSTGLVLKVTRSR